MSAVRPSQKAGRASMPILAEWIDMCLGSSGICGQVITGKIIPSFNKGWGKAEIEAEQRGRGFGLRENPFGDFAAGPDLSRRWDDVRRSIAFAAEGHGYFLVPDALCIRPVDRREVGEALLLFQHSALHEPRFLRACASWQAGRVGKECVGK